MPDANKNKANKAIVMQRARTVADWMTDGYFTRDIVEQGLVKWGVSERQVHDYIKEAFKIYREQTSKEIKDRIAFHVAARRKLYNRLKGKENADGARTALTILDSIAKIEGVFVEKIDVTSKGKELKTQTTVIKATLKLS
jgi:hypothetical protein